MYLPPGNDIVGASPSLAPVAGRLRFLRDDKEREAGAVMCQICLFASAAGVRRLFVAEDAGRGVYPFGGAKGAGRVEVCWAAGVGAGEGFLLRLGRVVLGGVSLCFDREGSGGLGDWEGVVVGTYVGAVTFTGNSSSLSLSLPLPLPLSLPLPLLLVSSSGPAADPASSFESLPSSLVASSISMSLSAMRSVLLDVSFGFAAVFDPFAGFTATAFLDSFLEGFEDAIVRVCGLWRRDWDRLRLWLRRWSRAFFFGGGR